jgi:ribose transport system substrate-binding protein
MARRTNQTFGAALGVIALLGLTACGPSTTSDSSSKGSGDAATTELDQPKQFESAQQVLDAYPTADLCGDKKLKLAFPAGIVNAWMKQTYQMILDEAAKCDNISFEITDAQVDQQKAVSDVNSLVAKGVDGIVTLPIFGAAQVPSFRKAMQAGIPVVTFVSPSGGEVGTDVAAHISQDLETYGKGWADWLNTNLKSGTVLFLGNAPGQPSSEAAFTAFKKALAQYPDLKLVEPDWQPTNNSAATKKQVMAAMLAKHGRIDAVVSDNGAIDSAVIDAYKQAGMKLPYLADANATNGLLCAWDKDKFPLFSWDGSNDEGPVALRRLLATINDIPLKEATTVRPFVSADTTKAGYKSQCDASLSPDVDWSTGLSADQLAKILG